MQANAPTFLSLFSGIGGFDLGLERAGWRCAGQVEIDGFCNRVLARHWPATSRWGDIRTVGAGSPEPALRRGDGDAAGGRGRYERLPPRGPVDLLCGGFPCQDLSVAGRRAGLAGPRSGLFFEFVRVATELRPGWLLLENVPGLLSSNGGRDFAVVLAALGDAGYGVGWRVLDARWFGVPQRRRRVFLVGRLGAPCPPEVLFEPQSVPGHLEAGREAGADVAYPIAPGAGGSKFGSGRDSQDTFVTGSHELSPPLMAEGFDTSEDRQGVMYSIHPDATHRTGDGAYRQPGLGIRQDGTSYTMDADRPPMIGTAAAVRRLTPTECERLQAFPDGWSCLCGVEPYSTWDCRCPDGPRYAALGNAVTTTVVEWIGRRLIRAL